MNFVLVFVLTTLAIVRGIFPPGLQYNPYFNSQQNQLPPGLQFNPFFNNQNYTNPVYVPPSFPSSAPRFNYTNFWTSIFGRNPFLSSAFGPTTGVGFGPRALGGYPFYYPYSGCITNNYQQCNGSHSVYMGCLQSQHRVLFRQSYVKPGRWYSKREKIIHYPGDLPPGLVRNDTITAIHILDRNCNGTGGYAEILPGGGVGYRWVTIRLYSTGIYKGFNFYVQIFGL